MRNYTYFENFSVSLARISMLIIFSSFLLACDKENAAPVAVPAFEFETSGSLEYGVPLTVQFADRSTNVDSETQYAWDFGDGSISSDKTPTHTYSKGGTYMVKLKLTNSDGKVSDVSRDVDLTSPIVGVWKLDSAAVCLIDSFTTKYEIRTAIEFGKKNGWSGTQWTSVGDDGYGTFWSNVIFKGNYLGRKSFFAVEYEFTADGKFVRDEKGELPGAVFFSEERDYLETETWTNTEGVSLDEWKSGEYTWTMVESTYTGRTDVVIDGGKGGFLGLYFAGSLEQVPTEPYTYTLSLITNDQLVVTGVSNLFSGEDDVFVLKFKRVQ